MKEDKGIFTLGVIVTVSVLLLFSILISNVHGATIPGNDTILGPLNGSQFAFNSPTQIDLSVYVGNVHGNLSDQIGIYVNDQLYSVSNYSSNGAYRIPITFYNQGSYSVVLVSSLQSNVVLERYYVSAANNSILGFPWYYLPIFAAIIIAFIVFIWRSFRY